MAWIKNNFRPEYCALINAIHRCHNEDHAAYADYGARGIQVCDAWRDPKTGFDAFMNHVGPRPDASFSLDRIDNDVGGYCENNVRWVDRTTQQRNRRQQREIAADYGWGIGKTPRSSNQAGFNYSALMPANGRTQTIVEWARESGIRASTIRQRLKRGLSPEEALNPAMQTPRPRRAGKDEGEHG